MRSWEGLYAFIQKKKKTRRNARQQREHMTPTVQLQAGMICQLSYYRVQLQVGRMHCPISAQTGQVITNHVRAFLYGFD